MGVIGLDSFEQGALGKVKLDITDKLEGLNKTFKSGVEAIEGKFGSVEQNVGENLTKTISRNELGNAVKSYFQDGKLINTMENVGDGLIKTVRYDDNGNAYLKEVTDVVKYRTTSELTPNIEIVKGNITTKIDSLGRVASAKIEGLKVKDTPRVDNELNKLVKDGSYRPGDQKGHLIPDRFGGPATKENIVAECGDINNGIGKKVENFAAKLSNDGHKVDYEKTPNYVGSDSRPSSFDVKITVDGVDSKEFIKNNKAYENYSDLPDKIYNNEKFSNGEMSTVQKMATTVGEKVGLHHEAGIEAGAMAAKITCAISTVDNVSSCLNGEISATEAAINIAKDTGTAGVVGYGAGFVTNAVASSMASSSHTLIASLGNSCVPAAAVSMGIASYDSVMDFAKGEIEVDELAYDLGESAAGVAGSIGGAALAGAAVGSVVPIAGTAVGAGVGVVGGMVGYAVASGAYASAVEMAGDAIEECSEEIEKLGNKAKDIADDTISKAADIGEDAVKDVKAAISNFNIKNALPF